jgi:hypothetical protein
MPTGTPQGIELRVCFPAASVEVTVNVVDVTEARNFFS